MRDVLVYLPEFDELVILEETEPDAIEIGFRGHFDISFMRTFIDRYNNIDDVYI